jgi:rare lipoprotein A
VRVNDRGPFVGDRIIDLSREAARELGYDRQGLARVRVRYVGPAPLLGPDAGVRIARAEPPRPPPPLAPPSAPVASAPVVFTAAPLPAAAPPLQVSPSMPVPAAPSARAYRIQAGAFSQEVNARRAAAQLGALAPAVVEPLSRDGVTLYRVFLSGPADELQAYGLREQVARAGFADARVVGPF